MNNHPFSEKSKEMIHDMSNVKYFEMCDIFPNVQRNRYLKCWTIGIVYCSCGPCTIQARQDTLNAAFCSTPFGLAPIHVNSPGSRCGFLSFSSDKRDTEVTV